MRARVRTLHLPQARDVTVALIQTDDDELADEVGRLALVAAVPVIRTPPGQPAGAARLLLTDPASLGLAPPGQPLAVVSRAPLAAATLAAALKAGARAALHLPADEARLISLLLAAAAEGARGSLVAVVGASGGVGASTFAAAVAAALQGGGGAVLMIDLDPWGGGADLLLGLEAVAGPRWSALAQTSGRLSPTALREALPRWRDVSVLSNDGVSVPPAALLSVGSAAVGDGGRAVLDLPRSQLSEVASSGLVVDLGLLVAADDVPGVAAARRLAPVLRPLAARVETVLLHASGAVDDVVAARTIGIPVTTRLPVDQRLSRRALRGMPGEPSRAVLSAARAAVGRWEHLP